MLLVFPYVPFVFCSRFSSKLEPGDDLALPRRAGHCRVVDESETGRRLAIRIVVIHPALHHLRICRTGIVEKRAVEQVGKLYPHVQCQLLSKVEQPPDRDILERPPRLPVVVIKSGGAELPGSRVAPGLRIQRKRGIRIEAVAVEISR